MQHDIECDPFTAPLPPPKRPAEPQALAETTSPATALPTPSGANAQALEALIREATQKPVDEAALQRHLEVEQKRLRIASATGQSAALRQIEAQKNDQTLRRIAAERIGKTASAEWSELDLLAFKRAALHITAADGFGLTVEADELAALTSRKPDQIAAAARRLTRRLAEAGVTAPTIDTALIAAAPSVAWMVPPTP